MTRTETIKDKIRLDILSGALPQGEKLTLSFLSKRYVSSHMPVREALRALNGEGLVTFEANQGATIRAIDANFIETIFEVRCAIEGLAARKAISQIAEADIAQLQLHQRELEKATLAQDGQAACKNNRLSSRRQSPRLRSSPMRGKSRRSTRPCWAASGPVWATGPSACRA